MDNALPAATPHSHDHHGHQHAHVHPHEHGHRHSHHDESPAPARADERGFSLISLSGLARLALSLPPIAALWLMTYWAMQNG